MWLCQMNFATAIAPLDSPLLSEFVENLDRINALAEASDGFIWRLQDEGGNATSIRIMTDPKAVLNVSVWRSLEDLYRFTFKSDHSYFVKNRDKWFVPTTKRSLALWMMPEGDKMPDEAEAFDRLRHLEIHGATAFAFDFMTAKHFMSSKKFVLILMH